jgi:hypothetical protein
LPFSAATLAFAILVACLGWSSPVAAKAADPGDDAYCTVRVARVVPVDASGTTQAVLVQPALDGSATLSGTIALFTADDRRYDVPFPATLRALPGTPALFVYRFARPVVITGAYVAALGGPAAGPCGLSFPWSNDALAGPPASDADIAKAAAAATATPVAEPGSPDPLTCAVPNQPARTIHADSPFAIAGATGNVIVRVTIAPDGHPLFASLFRVDASLDSGTGEAGAYRARRARAEAIDAALASTYETQVFRCRHVFGVYLFSVAFGR